MSSTLYDRCKNCGKIRGHHNSVTKACPTGTKSRVGYITYASDQFFDGEELSEHTELIKSFAEGTTHQYITTVVDSTENFVLFKIAGHNYWSGLGRPWRYAPQEYVVIRKGIHGSGKGKRWTGRMTKARRVEIMAALKAAELWKDKK